MNEEVSREPVDNSHRDAGIAARDSQKEPAAAAEQPKPKAVQDAPPKDKASDAPVVDDNGEDTQNDTGESADPGDGEQAKPKNKGVGKRIDELTKARYDAERDRDYWREQAVRQQSAKPEAPPESAPAAARESDEPSLESCDFDQAEFQRKWYDWRRSEDQKIEAAKERSRAFADREAAFRAEHPDYDAVARNPALPITEAVAAVILDCDDPPAIAYYLGQHPDEAAAIAQMTPHQIGRAIGRIEATLSAPPEPARQLEPSKTVTRAPPPVTTVSGAPAVKKSVDDMSMAEYDAHRRAERAAKGLTP